MGYRKASQVYNVPKGTIERYIKDNRNVEDLVKVGLGRKQALPDELERKLAEYCIEMEKKNGLRHPFSKKSETEGKTWLKGFLSRHPQLSVRHHRQYLLQEGKGLTPRV
ncbi:CENP-B N-terminal DNA-binding domain [Popillia japonica]|uniref:CENP-B N-terminal DNA-binding domain n=1 Tax=Popillia japonica TaxID=7064 RepID=A0AAW1KHH3_POPJA